MLYMVHSDEGTQFVKGKDKLHSLLMKLTFAFCVDQEEVDWADVFEECLAESDFGDICSVYKVEGIDDEYKLDFLILNESVKLTRIG